MSTPSAADDAPADLQALRERQKQANPQIYRDLALHLQVLREVLPACVEQACFHLVTQVHATRYSALADPHRRRLHLRMAALVKRCCSLLTVEQLAHLACQMAVEASRRRRTRRQRLLERAGTPEAASEPEPPLPQGSVSLAMDLPLAGPIGAPWPGQPDAPAEESFWTQGKEAEVWRHPFPPGRTGEPPAREAELEQAADPDPWSGGGQLWQRGRLPQEPLPLLRWLEGYERALERRLRNLSHAINVELFRAGITPGLLPVSLLDAVLAAQVESQAAPANVMRLSLPGPPLSGLEGSLQAFALLLRSVDLELEHPSLRTCRRRLEQHRQELRRMAQQFRRLKRRLEVREAERLWRQDTRRTRQQNP